MALPLPFGVPVHPFAERHVRDLVGRVDPEVVHFHMGAVTPSVQASLEAAAGRARVLEVHSVWTPGVVRAYRTLDRLITFPPQGVQLASVSETAAGPVRAAFGRDVEVVPNGVDLDFWKVEPVDHRGVHVVSALRFATRKRPEALLEILAQASRELVPDGGLTATLAGDGPGLERVREWVRSEGLDDRISLPGRLPREDLRELYRRSDIYLNPAILEAFPVSVLEARAAGLVVLARSQAGSAEQFEHGVNGIAADTDEELAAALVRLVREPDELTRLRQGCEENPPRFDWPRVVQRNAEVYEMARRMARSGGR
ncbi:MAG TPA: glycosyltransferase family 4 protein [Actinomycetales bacterium]|nr:glycosyltransferase family 4 protein [Actinomycetales bacterium]